MHKTIHINFSCPTDEQHVVQSDGSDYRTFTNREEEISKVDTNPPPSYEELFPPAPNAETAYFQSQKQ